MIIQLVGSNGSGKSTAVRAVIAAGYATPVLHPEGTGRLVGYDLALRDFSCTVHVIGKYGDYATAGCDALKDPPWCYHRVRELHWGGRHVLFEGIRQMGHTEGLRLQRDVGEPIQVLQLTTTLEECYEGITARRTARGSDKQGFTKEIGDNVKRARAYAFKLSEIGAKVHRVSRAEAPLKVLELLRGYTP